MEEEILKLIDLDNNAKKLVDSELEKKDNIEIYISEKIKYEKEKIDNRFSFKKTKVQEKFEKIYEEEKNK